MLFFDVQGQVYVNITDLSLLSEVSFLTQEDKTTGKLAPAVKLENFLLGINPDNISIRLEGSLVAKIASLFTELFKKEILVKLIENVKKQI